MVGLSQTALNLGDRTWATTLYRLIEPYADHNCRAGQATFLGAASLQLGELALLLENNDVAVGHFESALARHDDMDARPFAAMTKHLLSIALRRTGSGRDRSRVDALEQEAALSAASLGAPRAVRTPAP
jgi:hypothetical protein